VGPRQWGTVRETAGGGGGWSLSKNGRKMQLSRYREKKHGQRAVAYLRPKKENKKLKKGEKEDQGGV